MLSIKAIDFLPFPFQDDPFCNRPLRIMYDLGHHWGTHFYARLSALRSLVLHKKRKLRYIWIMFVLSPAKGLRELPDQAFWRHHYQPWYSRLTPISAYLGLVWLATSHGIITSECLKRTFVLPQNSIKQQSS